METMIGAFFFLPVRCLPFLVLELYAFRGSLRFSWKQTAAGLVLLGIFLGLPGLLPGYSSALSLMIAEIVGSLLCGLFFLLTTQERLGKQLYMLLMIGNVANLAAVTAQCLLHYLMPELDRMWVYTLVQGLCEVPMLLPLFLYVQRVQLTSLEGNQRANAWQYLWLIPLTFWLIWVFDYYFVVPGVDWKLWFVTLMIVVGGTLVYSIVAQLIQQQAQNRELREREYRLNIQQSHYDHLQDRIEEARRAKHDLRHHIHVVSAYLQDGKLAELESYLRQYSDTIPDDSRISYCDHYAANALLSYFAWQARAASIDYQVTVSLPPRVGIPDDALTVVLGNLLENAIAACKAERLVSPKITVQGKLDQGAVFFRITNTCTRSISRTPAEGHGIGLTSVQNIAEEYDGILETTHSSGIFTAAILLNVP